MSKGIPEAIYDAYKVIEKKAVLAEIVEKNRKKMRGYTIPRPTLVENEPISQVDLIRRLKDTEREWNWTSKQNTPLKWEEQRWEKTFEELGFGVLQFAEGRELKELQEEARVRGKGDGRKRARSPRG